MSLKNEISTLLISEGYVNVRNDILLNEQEAYGVMSILSSKEGRHTIGNSIQILINGKDDSSNNSDTLEEKAFTISDLLESTYTNYVFENTIGLNYDPMLKCWRRSLNFNIKNQR